MPVTVNLNSAKSGEIKKFLESFYEKPVCMEDDIEEWRYIYNKPLEAIDLISCVIDNAERYDLAVSLRIDDGDIHIITQENSNDIIKGLFYLYYCSNSLSISTQE